MVFEEFEWSQEVPQNQKTTAIIVAKPQPTWMDSDPQVAQMPETTIPVVQQYAEPIQLVADNQIPMRTVKMLSIKPVPEDQRPALWDGVHGQYAGADGDKTVDWRDGVPIWDDSIASYKYKDFSDWFLEPTPEIYLRELSPEEARLNINPKELYLHTMEDAAATRARVEELLAPKKPSGNLWFENLEITETPVQEDITVRAVVEQETIIEKQEPVIVEQATITEIAQPVVSVQQETVAMPVIPVALVAEPT
jgi:hypothetical protein